MSDKLTPIETYEKALADAKKEWDEVKANPEKTKEELAEAERAYWRARAVAMDIYNQSKV